MGYTDRTNANNCTIVLGIHKQFHLTSFTIRAGATTNVLAEQPRKIVVIGNSNFLCDLLHQQAGFG
ncbi:hypothetical protein SAMN03159341_1347 [Paenibacillus sp. 1_12]|nr:hypothetical protein SAMN03159341_1347 [Paenibacillus sp. 1_12]